MQLGIECVSKSEILVNAFQLTITAQKTTDLQPLIVQLPSASTLEM